MQPKRKNALRLGNNKTFVYCILALSALCLLIFSRAGNAEINVDKVMAELKDYSQSKDYYYEMDEETVKQFLIDLNTVHIGDSMDDVVAKLKATPSDAYVVHGYKHFFVKYVRYYTVKYHLKKLYEFATVLNYDLIVLMNFDANKKLYKMTTNIETLSEDERFKFAL